MIEFRMLGFSCRTNEQKKSGEVNVRKLGNMARLVSSTPRTTAAVVSWWGHHSSDLEGYTRNFLTHICELYLLILFNKDDRL